MAPTTRAAARRLASVPNTVNVPGHGDRTDEKQVAQADALKKTGYLIDDLCRILDLPAELRNRIYDYAAEELDLLKWAPRIGRRTCKPWNERLWKFFGLTQTCVRIRSEFGPIWLRKLNVRCSTRELEQFIPTFFPTSRLSGFGPQRIQVLWDVGLHDNKGDKHDLTHMIQLQFRNSSEPFIFGPERLVDGEGPENICWYCFGEMEAQKRGEDDFENWVERCTCAPENMPYDDWVAYQYDLINPTDYLLGLIRHNNDAWKQDVLSGKLEVQCVFGRFTEPITFRILCKERFCEVEGNHDAALHAENLGVAGALGHLRTTCSQNELSGCFQDRAENYEERIRVIQYGRARSAYQENQSRLRVWQRKVSKKSRSATKRRRDGREITTHKFIFKF